jgi:predicted nucleic acid-binding protein
MPFVIDTSVAASWLLPDEGRPESDQAYARLATDYALVPSLWWFEMRNLFVTNERRGRIDSARTSTALALLAGLPIRIDNRIEEGPLMLLARQHRLSVYDAAYLEIAQREAVPLATLDMQLADAARAEGVLLIGDSTR